jgi:type VI secretion system secreted protein VgrG
MANTKVIRIEIDGFPDDAYDVVSFRGTESISSLFRYHISLASMTPTQDFDAILEAKAHLILGDPAMHVRGILASIQQGYEGAWKTETGALTRVDVVLVPELYKLSLTSQTRIFQEMSVPDIVKKILNDYNIPGGDTEWKLSGNHEKKEFVLQHQESDLDFCQRLLDYDGIHYHFELGEDATKIVFGDSNSAFGTIWTPSSAIPAWAPGGTSRPSRGSRAASASFRRRWSCRTTTSRSPRWISRWRARSRPRRRRSARSTSTASTTR